MSYSTPYQNNPYGQGPSAEADYGYGQQEQHEMQPYGGQQSPPAGDFLDRNAFLNQKRQLQQQTESLQVDLDRITALYNSSRYDTAGTSRQQLDTQFSETRTKTSTLRDQLRNLKQDAERTTNRELQKLKVDQLNATSATFKQVYGNYLALEQQIKQSTYNDYARQYKIANPAAGEEEIRHAAETNQPAFQQAFMSSRVSDAQRTLQSVQERNAEVLKIEQAMTELAILFQDLDTMVIQQDAIIVRAEQQTEETNENLNKGTEEVKKGIEHALRTRRNKWICAFIVIFIIIAIGLGVGLGIYFNQPKKTQ